MSRRSLGIGLVAAAAVAVAVAVALLAAGAGDGGGHRFVVATPERATLARAAPYEGPAGVGPS